MRHHHQATAVPFALTTAWVGLTFTTLPAYVPVGMAVLVWHASDWPDLDNPAASINRDLGPITRAIGIIVRAVSRYVWLFTRTAADRPKPRGDVHRDFTHSVEGCALFGLTIAGLWYLTPGDNTYGWCFGLAAFVGCITHLVADSLTPSGVPWSIIYNRLAYGETWRRHQVGKRGWFATNSGGERTFVFLAVWPVTIILALVFTGLIGPIFHIITGK